jgi:hypothetical protein
MTITRIGYGRVPNLGTSPWTPGQRFNPRASSQSQAAAMIAFRVSTSVLYADTNRLSLVPRVL